MGISVLNIGIEVMLIVSQKKRSAEVDDTDGLLAHWLAPIGTVMESKRARRHGLWTRPSVSRSLSPHQHELPGYGIRSDCESVLAEGRGDPFAPKNTGWGADWDSSDRSRAARSSHRVVMVRVRWHSLRVRNHRFGSTVANIVL